MRTLVLGLAVAVAPIGAAADDIYLTSGGQVSGRIVEPHGDVDRGRHRRRPHHRPHLERGPGRRGPLPAPRIRGSLEQDPRERRRGLAGPGRVGLRAGARVAGARGVQPRAQRGAGRPAGERRPRAHAGGRPLAERGRELPGARLRPLRRGVDDAGRARGDPARARSSSPRSSTSASRPTRRRAKRRRGPRRRTPGRARPRPRPRKRRRPPTGSRSGTGGERDLRPGRRARSSAIRPRRCRGRVR